MQHVVCVQASKTENKDGKVCADRTCPTSQVFLQLSGVLDEVIKLHLSSLEELLRVREGEDALFGAGVLKHWRAHVSEEQKP